MNLNDADFVAAFSRFVRRRGRWRAYEPSELVGQWIDFVVSCVEGFQGDADEDYFNLLTCRGELEDAMNAPELANYPQMELVRSAVSIADEKFRPILVPDAFPKIPESKWWLRGMVRYAGPQLAADLRRSYGITIETV
jgi:hypothetical protein